MVEYLLLNGARINVLDGQLDTPLHIAAAKGHTLYVSVDYVRCLQLSNALSASFVCRQVCQLLKRGAHKDLKNQSGLTPLDLAVEGKFADIVTL